MELRHLRYFVAVAEELNFTRAAERMHIGQPPLSMQIRDLEEEIGTPLFRSREAAHRVDRAGRRFLDHARGILAQSRAAVEEARRAGRGEAGELRIGFASSLAYTSDPRRPLYRYRQRYPQVGLQLREMFTLDQLGALARGELDVGFVRHGGLEVPVGVGVREIGRDPLRLVVNAAHPLAGAGAVSAQTGFATTVSSRFRPTSLRFAVRARTLVPQRRVRAAHRADGARGDDADRPRRRGLGVAMLPGPLECVRLPRVRYLALLDEGAYFSLAVAAVERTPSPLLAGFLAVLDEVAASPE